MVAPWIKKKRAAQAAKKTAKKAVATPQPKAAKKTAPAPKPAPVVEETPVVEAAPEAVTETAPEPVEESAALDLTSMYKWQLVSHAQSLGHDVTGLTKSEILELLAQD